MSWITITADDVARRLAAAELSALKTAAKASGQDGDTILAEAITEVTTEGRLTGVVTRQPLGRGGFGYDPVFRPEGSDLTLAELEPGDKHRVSHRGRALARLKRAVRAAYGV